MKKLFVVVMVMIFAMGCAKKYVAPTDEQMMERDVKAGEEVQVVEQIPSREIEEPESMDISSARELPFEFKDALFDFDKYDIRPDARAVLDETAKWLNENKNLNIIIEGHCDERGTNEYNLALGEKRARSARTYLLSKGIAHVRVQSISYGEEKPVCLAQSESCWQKNRRAHFVVSR
jgi:peptidoglycan-associated lipoprotein